MKIMAAVAAAALAVAGGTACAASVHWLAYHPQCYVIGGHVFVRGGVLAGGQPVAGAVVVLEYGARQLRATTNSRGVYVATAPADPRARRVAEVATYLPAASGPTPWSQAKGFDGACRVASVSLGQPEQR